jgi:hypothetical protein
MTDGLFPLRSTAPRYSCIALWMWGKDRACDGQYGELLGDEVDGDDVSWIW